jgi:hypothetical protein
MSEKTINAGANAQLANNLIDQALSVEPEQPVAEIAQPSENLVSLPGGLIFAGELMRTAEVRELNGRDEEVIAKSAGSPRIWNTILSRAVVTVGTKPATEELLDSMLAGDRDALLLGICRATFGNEAELSGWCESCREVKPVVVDLNSDIKTKILVDPVEDRTFTVKNRGHEFRVTLPTGTTSKELANNPELNYAESLTLLLKNTVLEIDGKTVYSPMQIQNLSITDRRAISEALAERNPGPQLTETTAPCPKCGGEVVIPISFGALFQF